MDDNHDPSVPRMEVVEQSSLPHSSEPYEDYESPKRPPNKRLITTVIISAVVLLLLAGAGGVYWMLAHKRAPTPQPAASTSDQSAAQITPDTTTSTDNPPGAYVSNGKDLNLQFTYPDGWTASPPSGSNASDQPITVTSPLVSLNGADGSVTGKIIFSIRPGTSDISELASGKATAGLASEQIAYAKPTKNQHQYPYVTFIHLQGGQDQAGVFEEVMITGINQFTKGQGITTFSLGQLDPIISAAFYQCMAQACSGDSMKPLSISASTWQTDDMFKQVEAIFESLQLN